MINIESILHSIKRENRTVVCVSSLLCTQDMFLVLNIFIFYVLRILIIHSIRNSFWNAKVLQILFMFFQKIRLSVREEEHCLTFMFLRPYDGLFKRNCLSFKFKTTFYNSLKLLLLETLLHVQIWPEWPWHLWFVSCSDVINQAQDPKQDSCQHWPDGVSPLYRHPNWQTCVFCQLGKLEKERSHWFLKAEHWISIQNFTLIVFSSLVSLYFSILK